MTTAPNEPATNHVAQAAAYIESAIRKLRLADMACVPGALPSSIIQMTADARAQLDKALDCLRGTT